MNKKQIRDGNDLSIDEMIADMEGWTTNAVERYSHQVKHIIPCKESVIFIKGQHRKMRYVQTLTKNAKLERNWFNKLDGKNEDKIIADLTLLKCTECSKTDEINKSLSDDGKYRCRECLDDIEGTEYALQDASDWEYILEKAKVQKIPQRFEKLPFEFYQNEIEKYKTQAKRYANRMERRGKVNSLVANSSAIAQF